MHNTGRGPDPPIRRGRGKSGEKIVSFVKYRNIASEITLASCNSEAITRNFKAQLYWRLKFLHKKLPASVR